MDLFKKHNITITNQILRGNLMTLMKYITVVNLLKNLIIIKHCCGRSRISSGTDLATTNAVRNKTPNLSGLVKKESYDTKISDIDTKFFTTSDCNKFIAEILHKKGKTLLINLI